MKYYRLEVIAEAYRISKGTLMAWCRSGKLAGVKVPNHPDKIRSYIWMLPETELVKLEEYKLCDPEYEPHMQPNVIMNELIRIKEDFRKNRGEPIPDILRTHHGMRAVIYDLYMNTPEYKAKRLEVLKRDGFVCQLCGSGKNLQVHHINYDNLGTELETDDLITLCGSCHDKRVHGKDTSRVPAVC